MKLPRPDRLGSARQGRVVLRKCAPGALLRVLLTDGSTAMVLYRLMQWSRRWRLAPLEMLFNRSTPCSRLHHRPRGRAWPPIRPVHATGVVINGSVRGGSGVHLEHQVTIGAERRQSPVLGDGVFVGAGAKVLGSVRWGTGHGSGRMRSWSTTCRRIDGGGHTRARREDTGPHGGRRPGGETRPLDDLCVRLAAVSSRPQELFPELQQVPNLMDILGASPSRDAARRARGARPRLRQPRCGFLRSLSLGGVHGGRDPPGWEGRDRVSQLSITSSCSSCGSSWRGISRITAIRRRPSSHFY